MKALNLILLSAILTGCGGGSSSSSEQDAIAPEITEEPTALVFFECDEPIRQYHVQKCGVTVDGVEITNLEPGVSVYLELPINQYVIETYTYSYFMTNHGTLPNEYYSSSILNVTGDDIYTYRLSMAGASLSVNGGESIRIENQY